MSGTGGKCPSCGEFAVIKEEKEGQFVCEECGVVVESGILVNSLGFAESRGPSGPSNSLPTDYFNRNSTSELKPLLFGVRRVKEVGQVLNFTPPMIEEVIYMFKEVYHSKNVFQQSLHIKTTVALCCVYIVGRQYGWPLAKSTMSVIGQREVGEIVHWINVVIELRNLSITSPDVEELVPDQVSKWNLSRSVEENAVKILQLVKNTWLSAGKGVQGVVQAAVFIAYEAERCKMGIRGRFNFKMFSKEVKCKNATTFGCQRLVPRIKTVLCRLGTEVPWVGSGCNLSNLCYHLSDILQYQNSLLYDITRQREETESGQNNPSRAENCSEHDPTSQPSHEAAASKDDSTDLTSSEVNDRVKDLSSPERKRRKMSEDIFTPQCYRENRQKSREEPATEDSHALIVKYPGDIDSCELNDLDIAENEFSQYLRTKQEIKFLSTLTD